MQQIQQGMAQLQRVAPNAIPGLGANPFAGLGGLNPGDAVPPPPTSAAPGSAPSLDPANMANMGKRTIYRNLQTIKCVRLICQVTFHS